MANSIINTTSVSSLQGHISHALSQLKGDQVTLIKGTTGDANIYTLKKSSPINSKAIKSLEFMSKQKLNLINYKDGLKKIPIELHERIDFTPHAGNIMKNGEKVPFGYLAEAIVQAAIVAKFTSKRDSSVTVADIIAKLKDYFNKPSNKTIESYLINKPPAKSLTVNKALEYIGKNKNPKIEDHVFVYYALNDGAFNWLKSKLKGTSVPSDLQTYFNDAAAFANSGNVQKHSEYFFTNGRKDRIDIVSLGVIGQGETKADIGTTYYEGYQGKPGTGKKTNFFLKLSVKINRVTQVGQLTGIDGEAFSRLTNHFGVKLNDNDKKKIDNLASKLKPKINDGKIQGQIYDIVYKQLSKANLNGIIQGITHFIAFTTTEAKVLSTVDIGSGLKTYFMKNLENMGKSLQGKRIISEIRTGGGLGVTKQIKYKVGDDELFSINSRYVGGTYRNFITTGELLRTFLSKA
jgi:hypothetical protein